MLTRRADGVVRGRRVRGLALGLVAAVGVAVGGLIGALGVDHVPSSAASAVAGSAVMATAISEDPVIAAAGDIACDPASRGFVDGRGALSSCKQMVTSDLLLTVGLTAVFPLGDLQYYCGSSDAFALSYGPSWGRVKDITHPVVGNHEYIQQGSRESTRATTGCDASNDGAAGYFDYFGAAAGDPTQGWYNLDIGAWHVVVLNSNCSAAGGCRLRSPQMDWLTADLHAHPNLCTVALWHHPRFSSGEHGDDADYGDFWDVLYAGGVDVVVNAHDHIYERFARQTPSRVPDDAHGIRQFVVGTGGANHTYLQRIAVNSEVRDDQSFGVLRMTLHADRYDWEFVAEPGSSFTDRGTDHCHSPSN
jgi:hypothetical protein